MNPPQDDKINAEIEKMAEGHERSHDFSDISKLTYDELMQVTHDSYVSGAQAMAELKDVEIAELKKELQLKNENGCCIVEHGYRMSAQHENQALRAELAEKTAALDRIAATDISEKGPDLFWLQQWRHKVKEAVNSVLAKYEGGKSEKRCVHGVTLTDRCYSCKETLSGK